MRTLMIIASAAAAFSVLAGGAEAKDKRFGYGYAYDTHVVVKSSSKKRKRQTMDDIRAHNADPTGQYAGWPSWARASLEFGSRR